MERRSFLSVALLLAMTALRAGAATSPVPPSSQVPVPEVLTYTNERAMARLMQKHSSDLRSSMRLTSRSQRLKLAENCAVQYQRLWEASPKDPHLKAEYAFAHAIGTWGLLYYPYTPEQQRLRELLNTYPAPQNVLRCREESLKELPNAPEVWLMAAESKMDAGKYKEAHVLTERALKLDPNWGEAHYIMGKTLDFMINVGKDQDQNNKWAHKAVKELQTAERLDPSLRISNILIHYASAYEQLGQYDLAIKYLERRIAADASLGGTPESRKALIVSRDRVAAKAKAKSP